MTRTWVGRWIASTIALGIAVAIVPGIGFVGTTETWIALLLTALVLSLVNNIVRPILQILSLPITILSLGIFYFIINTIMLYFAGWLSNEIFNVGFGITGFFSAFIASLIISFVSSIVEELMGE